MIDRMGANSRASYYVYRLLSGALQLMPSGTEQLIAVAAGNLAYTLRPRDRQALEENVEGVLGRGLEHAQLRSWVRRGFASYARYWVEAARLKCAARLELDSRMVCSEGWEHLADGMARGRGVIMALPHLGNFDFGGAWLAAVGYPMTSVAERLEPPELFEWFVAQRRSIGLDIYPAGSESSSAVLDVLVRGGLVGLVSDRDISGHGVPVVFFGHHTTFPAGPAALAMRSGAVLLPAAVYMESRGGHRGVILPPIDTGRRGRFREDVQRVTQDLAARLEGLIRRAPDQWHMFQRAWPAELASGVSGGQDLAPGAAGMHVAGATSGAACE